MKWPDRASSCSFFFRGSSSGGVVHFFNLRKQEMDILEPQAPFTTYLGRKIFTHFCLHTVRRCIIVYEYKKPERYIRQTSRPSWVQVYCPQDPSPTCLYLGHSSGRSTRLPRYGGTSLRATQHYIHFHPAGFGPNGTACRGEEHLKTSLRTGPGPKVSYQSNFGPQPRSSKKQRLDDMLRTASGP